MTSKNPFAQDPYAVGAGLTPQNVPGLPAGGTPADPNAGAFAAIEHIATQTKVPANILMAMDEIAGNGQGEETRAAVAARFASVLAPEIAKGTDVEAAVRALSTDDAQAARLLQRAIEIGQERYPGQFAPKAEPGVMNRLGKAFDQGFDSAVTRTQDMTRDAAAAAEESALGQLLAGARETVDENFLTNDDGSPNLMGRVTNRLRAVTESATGVPVQKVGGPEVTPETRAEAIRTAEPTESRDIAQWNLEKLAAEGFQITGFADIDGLGAAFQFAGENLVSSLPQMAAAIGSGALAPVSQTLMLGAEANEELKERTDLTEGKRVAVSLGAGSAMWAFDAIGLGYIFGKMLPSNVAVQAANGTLAKVLTGNGVPASAARIIQAGIIEGTTESIQEAIVLGATAVSGGEYSAQEVLMRLGEAFAAGGAVGSTLRAPVEPFDRLRAPVVDVDAGGNPVQPNAAGPTPQPEMPKESGGVGPAPDTPPPGRMERAAANAPEPVTSGLYEGDDIVLEAGTTRIEGVFVKEGIDTIKIKDENGMELEIPREEFDRGETSIARRSVEAEFDPLDEGDTPDPSLADQAAGAIRRPEPTVDPVQSEPTTKDLEDRIVRIEDLARSQGWTSDTLTERDDLQARLDAMNGNVAPLPADETQATAEAVVDELENRDAEIVTRMDGSPFLNEGDALRSLTNRRFNPEDYDIQPQDGGFVATPRMEDTRNDVEESTSPGAVSEPTNQDPDRPGAADPARATGPEPIAPPDVTDAAGGAAPGPSDESGTAGFVAPDVAEPAPGVQPEAAPANSGPITEAAEAKAEGETPIAEPENAAIEGKYDRNTVSKEGPWDFNAAWPSPDPDKLSARVANGQQDFAVNSPEEVVSTLQTTMADAVDARVDALDWADKARTIQSGGKPDFSVKKGQTHGQTAISNAQSAAKKLEDLEATLRDVWPDAAVDSMAEEVVRIADEMRAAVKSPVSKSGSVKKAQPKAAGDPAGPRVFVNRVGRDGMTDAERGGPLPKATKVDPDQPPEPEAREAESVETHTMKGKRGKASVDLFKVNVRKWPEGYDVTGSYEVPGFAGGTVSTRHKSYHPTPEAALAEAFEFSTQRHLKQIADGKSGATPAQVVQAKKMLDWIDGISKSVPQKPTKADGVSAKGYEGKGFAQEGKMLVARNWLRVNGYTNLARIMDLDASKEYPVDASIAKADVLRAADEDTNAWPQPNDSGIYDENDATAANTFELPFKSKKRAGFAGSIHVLEVAPDTWVGSADLNLPSGWLGSPLTGPPFYSTRKDALAAKIKQTRDHAENARKNDSTVTKKEAVRTLDWLFDIETANPEVVADTAAPTKAEVTVAAAEADPAPTDAQKEAGNYKMGHLAWNGLDITIENAKGSKREGTDADGEKWSVTMPAHYGYIKKTRGADGDHLDVYIGDTPESDFVLVVDQTNPDTGAFDEHKIILGTPDEAAARALYEGGFSDGRGAERIGGVTKMDVERFKNFVANNNWTNPASLHNLPEHSAEPQSFHAGFADRFARKPKVTPSYMKPRSKGAARWVAGWEAANKLKLAPPMTDAAPDTDKTVKTLAKTTKSPESNDKPGDRKDTKKVEKPAEYGASNTLVSSERAAELRTKLMAKLKDSTRNGIDPEMLALGTELAVFHIEAGARRFVDMARAIAADLQTDPKTLKPYLRSWYNGARDMMEDSGLAVDTMDDPTVVRTLLQSGAIDTLPAGISTPPEVSDTVVGQETEPTPNDIQPDASDSGPRADQGAGSATKRKAGTVRKDTSADGSERDLFAERPSDGPGAAQDGGRDSVSDSDGGSDQRNGPRNHVIPPDGLTLAKGRKTRARESVAAIQTLRDIQASGMPATRDQRESLAKYGGAGTLAGALSRSDGTVDFPDLQADLDRLLNAEEKTTLDRTSQYAFFTSEAVLRNMWRMAQRLGFDSGLIYEPGMGVGGFAGTMPNNLRGFAEYQGIELDHVTADIAQALYPQHNIKRGDYIKTPMPKGYYDMVIGNPPFSGTKIKSDPDYPQGFMLHDYFFAKSLDAVRPGGLLMFVTSAGTLNKQDTAARAYLADQADLVAAVRLPKTAFKENGTEVTTDIVILRKRLDGEAESNPSWRKSVEVQLDDGEGGTGPAFVNQYFVDNPNMILGEQGFFDTLVGQKRVGVRPRAGEDLGTALKAVADALPEKVMGEKPTYVERVALDTQSAEKKSGSFYLKDGELHQFNGTSGEKVAPRSREHTKGMPKAQIATIKQIIPIRDALRDVYALDVQGQDATAARKRLNKAYDTFVKKNGPLGLQKRSLRRPSSVEIEGLRQRAREEARAAGEAFDVGSFDPAPMLDSSDDKKPASMREVAAARRLAMEQEGYSEGTFKADDVPSKVLVKRPNIEPFMDDPESYRLLAIEHYDDKSDTATKSRVFKESAVTRATEPVINSPEDALLHLLAETGKIDLDRIAELAGSDTTTVKQELAGKVFKNPMTNEYETRSKYLSGNVRVKLDEAEKVALSNAEFAGNVDALRDVQPDLVPSDDINVPVGANWFPAEVYADFGKELGVRLEAKFARALGLWSVSGDNNSQASKTEWGTPDLPFGKLMALVMNNKKIEVKRHPKDASSYVDDTATQAAKDKAVEINTKFREWFWGDTNRRAEMEERYNRMFNGEVAPTYDGAYLTTPGIDSNWNWRPHQTSVIARILQSGSTYMAHAVGAGKTSAMIGAGMEARRLGLAQKPMYSVPNHMLIQFTTEFYEQYPLAKILVADDRRFHTSRRKQFVADAALGDYDAIIITHSAFEKIPPSEATRNRVVEEMLTEVRELLEGLAETGFGEGQGQDRSILGSLGSMASILGINVKAVTDGHTKTRKKIEALIEAAEQRMARQTIRRDQDAVFNFDELGVDMLFYDEAHLKRKLSFATTNGDIKGIDPQGSIGSMDLFIKTRALEERNPGRSLVLASGTPITNTMAELFTITRYMDPKALEQRGITAFDGWAATFGTVESELEQLPDGGYKQVSRFSKFVNTPELSLMVRQTMDVVTSSDLDKYVTRPKLRGGKRKLVVVEQSPEGKAYQSKLADRMAAIAARKGPVVKGDDILLSVINDGRLSAIDTRLVGGEYTGSGSKLEKAIDNIYNVWAKGEKTPLHGVKPEGGYTEQPVEHGPSAQIVFSTLGLNPTKHNEAFAVHRHIRAALVRRGVPASDIVLGESLKTQALKQRAFNDMNEGKKRILIGSKTLFTGVNAQRRLIAVHNLDPLWFPADDEQRNGRALRQGNMNPEIDIFDYSTKGTYDATMWQMMGRKAGFIEGFFRGDPNMRDMEDLGEASQYQQATALSTKDPRVLELTDMRQKADTLGRRRRAVDRQRSRLESTIRYANHRIEQYQKDSTKWSAAAERAQDLRGDKFKITIEGKVFNKRKDAGTELIDVAEAAALAKSGEKRVPVGEISGFPLMLSYSKAIEEYYFELQPFKGDLIDAGFSMDPVGMARKIEGALGTIHYTSNQIEIRISEMSAESAAAAKQLEKLPAFKEQKALDELESKIFDLQSEMEAEAKPEKDKDMAASPQGWEYVESAEPDPPMTPKTMRAVAKDLNAEMARAGLKGKIGIQVVREVLAHTGKPKPGVHGNYRRWADNARIDIVGDTPFGPVGVLTHEIVHALRDSGLWGKPYGLFTQSEWRGLVKEANAIFKDDIAARYPKLSAAARSEEAVAELYRAWRDAGDNMNSASALDKIRQFLQALGNVLTGQGFQTAGRTMERMAAGDVGKRGTPKFDGPRGADREFREPVSALPAKATKASDRKRISQLLTDAMAGKAGLLSLVPGRPLFAELGKNIAGARKYLRFKEEMDAQRQDWHAKTDEVAQAWRKLISKDGKANKAMMDLMHDATREGVDPSAPFVPMAGPEFLKTMQDAPPGSTAYEFAAQKLAMDEHRKAVHGRLRPRFLKLPDGFQSMFRQVRDSYKEMGDAFEDAVLVNVRKSMDIGLKRAERRYERDIQAIKDDGLTGAAKTEATKEADARVTDARRRNGWGKNARISELRSMFESNKVLEPYFPLPRFGRYFVTLRDPVTEAVTSFSRFESEKAQMDYAKEQTAQGHAVQAGVIGEDMDYRDQVDPNFVADIEELLGETVNDPKIMDQVWQRWLETLPDNSVRKQRIHRKGTEGFDNDAFRAFGKNMFHGSHQLARLTHSLDMQLALEDSRREAEMSEDPNRNGLIVTEMERRHEFIMNPTGSKWAQAATSAAFVYYLGLTPAAAIVNLTQTTVVGIPVLSAGLKQSGAATVARALAKASKDFIGGKGTAANSKNLTKDEQAAMNEAYRRGTVDRTQSHDLAGVAETGVEYSDFRVRWMNRISYFFHHAERMNREVTFLASYRLAKKDGLEVDQAIDKAADLTWKTHFDYQNTSRPRLLQNDTAKVLLVFRNFNINMLWRLFRDSHQALRGATPEERKEARAQLTGITLSMMMHAGATGTWGYALTTMLVGLFFEGGQDEVEEELKRGMVELFGPDMAGMILKGVPGHLTGTDLSYRIGMPELWFRSPDRELEGRDLYTHWLVEMVGAVPAIGENMFRGVSAIKEGKVERGIETMVPKFARDLMQARRFAQDGVETWNGDKIVDEVTIREILIEAIGFSPARVSERYEGNRRLYNKQRRITDERRDVLKEAREAILTGTSISKSTIAKIAAFNRKHPTYPITSESIERSVRSKLRASARNEYGVVLNTKLNDEIRNSAAPGIYQ